MGMTVQYHIGSFGKSRRYQCFPAGFDAVLMTMGKKDSFISQFRYHFQRGISGHRTIAVAADRQMKPVGITLAHTFKFENAVTQMQKSGGIGMHFNGTMHKTVDSVGI